MQTEVIDGRIFLSGKVNEPEEKIKITIVVSYCKISIYDKYNAMPNQRSACLYPLKTDTQDTARNSRVCRATTSSSSVRNT